MAPPPQQSSQRPLSSQIGTLSLVSGLVEAFDSDSDGLIAAEELGGMVASLGYDAGGGEVAEMMRAAGDSDGDGLLSLAEVAAAMVGDAAAGDLAGALGAALSALDDDGGAAAGTTTVGAEELYEVLSCMGSLSADNCRDIVASLDGDGDGALDLRGPQACCAGATLIYRKKKKNDHMLSY